MAQIAIDFGTTNTTVASWQDGMPRLLHLKDLSMNDANLPLIPSLVYVEGTLLHFGETVRAMGLDYQQDNRLFRNFKRGIVASKILPDRSIDNKLWGYREIASLFMGQILDALQDTTIDQLILTVPVVAFESYLAWIAEIASKYGLATDKVRIVDESTAAALGYAVQEAGAPVLVVDFGGGTLDLSLVQLPQERIKTGGFLGFLRDKDASDFKAQVIAKAGQLLGGSDIDQWLLQDVMHQLELTPETLGDFYAPLVAQCEEAKIQLSVQETVSFDIMTAEGKRTLTLTRQGMEKLMQTHGLFDTLRHTLDKVMVIARQRGIYKEDIRYVLMVGGTSLIPSVQRQMQDYFTTLSVHAHKPFTAVVEGALQLSGGMGLQDYISHGYALRYLNEQGEHQYEEIIPMGQAYPSLPIDIILEAAHPNQEAVELVIGEISDNAISLVEVQYEGEQMVFVAQSNAQNHQIVPLNATDCPLIQLRPTGEIGIDRLNASFYVDEQRQLRVTVTDLQTGKILLQNATLASIQ